MVLEHLAHTKPSLAVGIGMSRVPHAPPPFLPYYSPNDNYNNRFTFFISYSIWQMFTEHYHKPRIVESNRGDNPWWEDKSTFHMSS